MLYDKFCWTVCFLELFCDEDISPFIDVLDDFHAVDVVELWMIDDHMLMTDYNDISTKSYCSRCSLLSYTVIGRPLCDTTEHRLTTGSTD